MKVCSKCATAKAKSEFKPRKSSSDGLHQWCAGCLAAYYREYEKRNAKRKALLRRDRYELNRPQILAARAEYYKDNVAAIKCRRSEYRKSNMERLRDAQLVWRKNNVDYLRLAKMKWAKANPGAVRSIRARRRAAELKATPSWASRAEIEKIYSEAARIQAETGIAHHVDHIVPLQGELVNGLHVPWNLRIITATENISKGNRL